MMFVLYGKHLHVAPRVLSSAASNRALLASFHSFAGLRAKEASPENITEPPKKVDSSANDLSKDGTNAQEKLEDNPHFAKLAEDFSSHDHIHLQESETEENDSFKLGSMLTRTPQHANHAHSHGLGNPMLVLSREQFKNNPGVRITWIGLLTNVGLAVGKFTGGVVFHSQALIADSVHAISDLVSDFLTLFSVGLATRKPTNDYPYGYGKVETIGSLAVSSILTTAGLSIGWSSLCAIAGPIVPHAILEFFAAHSHGHGHSHVHAVTDINAAWIAGGSIILKEWIYKATKKVALETKSNVLMANAWHHRVDSLTSLVALVTISSGYLFNIQSLDAVGGLIVSGLVVKAGTQGMVASIKELIDKSLPPTDSRYVEVETMTKEVLSKLISNNNSKKPYRIVDLTVMTSGPNMHANMVLEAPLQRWDNILSVSEFEIVTDHLRSVLYKNIPSLRRLNIEYVEERPELTEEEKLEIEKQKNHGFSPVPETETKASSGGSHSHGHSHSHIDLGGHTHKH
ncbi:Mmt2p [Kluyveromyces lactis]|uniref:KLLA0C16181p n=1 Tax=Kluyveromyces lactis (strain ATCC 8585 / CBS 2359 / DSM 70799 / NBRC 1267 / NRRL Y-1140 / WM37) TaxID=284590 RepID=Q6CT16_KLULA|nr:uncharacterized protein KLLA0_C16181g [Kluyveromyces lactis]CAH01774.1 KLLA0C16181p [Kluyveromyces lactis]|eukprot:XP_452923.1 uncharacterized protein KLLA0_C16181g [Kluyveromyces lactis]